ncbi:MAG: insulinase family protein [Candidatus Anammoxibacter sp.]
MKRVLLNSKTFFILLLLVFILTSAAEAAKGSKREISTLTIENGLDVFLVSDPDVHRSAAALAVGVGHLHDPVDHQGLAHYLEHMLFLGTKKYPEVGSYKKFLDEHSGASNAYTSGSMTNYFFQVSDDGFEKALDRFSDFFKAPLFDKTYSEREVKAVNNEHEKNKLSDGWRAGFVQNQMAEAGHPITKFGTGNLTTLAGDNSAVLMEFYKKYYVASNMKLAFISSLPMESLARLAREYFSDVADHPVELLEIESDFRKPLVNEYRLLKIKTIKDLRSLEIDFPTIRLVDYRESKPASIIGSLIGYEGKGSLLSKLKEEGLVLGLSAGGGSIHDNLNSFGISVSLTPEGLKEYKKVLKMVFGYIHDIRTHGVQEYTFKENQAMAQINFDWKNPNEGMYFVSGRASKMHDYKLEEMETLPYLITKYEPEVYKALLNTLIPENAMVTLSHNSVECNKKAPYYDTEYSFQTVGGDDFRELKKPAKAEGTSYPEKNDFIPYNLKLVEEEPHLIRDDRLAKVWFQFDSRFSQPKVYLSFLIETPLVYSTPRDFKLANLYGAAVRDSLNEQVYPIQMAGLSYSLSVNKKGISLTMGGYSERIEDLMRLVTKNLTEITIDSQKFENIKEAQMRGMKNRKKGKAYARGGYYNRLLWLEKQFTEEEEIEALEPLTLKDLKAYAGKLYEKAYITGMAHGNWTDYKVNDSVNQLQEALKSTPLPEEERFKDVVHVLKTGERYKFSREVEDNNSSLAYAIQVGEKGFELQARASMVASIIENSFYTQMRTNQQLGYIVWSFNQLVEDRMFLRLVIQSSTHGPFDMVKRVDDWILQTAEIFGNLSEQEFKKHQKSLIVSLEKEPDSIGEALSRLFVLATDEEGDFKYRKKMIEAVKSLKIGDVINTANQIFLNPETPRIEVLMRAKGSTEPVPHGVFSEVSKFKNRKR